MTKPLVHNHGPEDGPSLACPEHRIGQCRLDELTTRIAVLEQALAFAASCIKSGEPWTPTCEEIIGTTLMSPTPRPEEQR